MGACRVQTETQPENTVKARSHLPSPQQLWHRRLSILSQHAGQPGCFCLAGSKRHIRLNPAYGKTMSLAGSICSKPMDIHRCNQSANIGIHGKCAILNFIQLNQPHLSLPNTPRGILSRKPCPFCFCHRSPPIILPLYFHNPLAFRTGTHARDGLPPPGGYGITAALAPGKAHSLQAGPLSCGLYMQLVQ